MKDNHTPGEWMWGEFDSQLFISSNKLIGDIVGKDTTRDTTKSFKEHRDNFALMTAACNSYHKNCGPHAVECAESDLLGECLGLCEKAKNVLLFLDTFMDENTELPELIEKLKGVRAKAILTKRKGDK